MNERSLSSFLLQLSKERQARYLQFRAVVEDAIAKEELSFEVAKNWLERVIDDLNTQLATGKRRVPGEGIQGNQ